jgi:hypothetical protein
MGSKLSKEEANALMLATLKDVHAALMVMGLTHINLLGNCSVIIIEKLEQIKEVLSQVDSGE